MINITPSVSSSSTNSNQLSRYKKEAKKLKKDKSISHSKALELVAKQHGFTAWSEVVEANNRTKQLSLRFESPDITELQQEVEWETPDEKLMLETLERTEDLAPNIKSLVLSNRAFLGRTGVEYCVFEPTVTGLKKAILDATGPVRTYFQSEGFHDYYQQGKGPNNKVIKKAFYVSVDGITESKVSLYRPMTKDGDPRMWFTGLPHFAKAGDQIAIVLFEDCPYLILLSELDLSSDITKLGGLKILLDRYQASKGSVAAELLEKLRNIAKKPLPSVKRGSTSVGMSVEAVLGIEANSSKDPDYKGIEIKASRGSKNRSNLFAQVADWNQSECKSSAEILDGFGYERPEDFRLYCTVRANKSNSQGLMFKYDEKNDSLNEVHEDGRKVACWPGNLLRSRLRDKHAETFWIITQPTKIDGKDYFILKSVIHTWSPLTSQLMPLLDAGVITMDHLIKRANGKVREKGPLFKIDKTNLSLLFPEPVEYDLQDQSITLRGGDQV
ncbi:MAG: hypothetical protein ACI90U_001922 [Pseudomonadales bacterium]|jgi:hypothetical protein